MCGLLNTIKPGHMKSCPDGEVWPGKEACVLQRRDTCRDGLQNSCLCVRSNDVTGLSLTANGSQSNNLFYILFYLDTYTRKVSNIRFSGTSF